MQNEQKYLTHVLSRIRAAIGGASELVKERAETVEEQKRYIWENKDLDPQEIRSARENILNINAMGENALARRQRLTRMLDSPYFGRIDFNGEPLYIGVNTFHDFEAHRSFVHDWRAPVSSMYYDYELGPAAYTSPAGEVTGNISLKRQYRIRGGRIEYMFDSSVTVLDDILGRELSSNADERMRGIVATIQREQNRIIRDAEAPTLIIQGVAGSGKTSIALHRVAYLLYTYKDTLSSKDILIISPNKVFADYISNVLPELGEETVPEQGMASLLAEVLGGKVKYQTFFEAVAEQLEKPSAGFTERTAFKSTVEFASALDRFVLHLENNGFRAADVKIRHITIPSEYIDEQFRRFHRMAIRERFDPMADFILSELDLKYDILATTAERNMLRSEIRKMFASGMNDAALYKELFVWLGRPEMLKLRKGNALEYSDLAPMAYLHIALDGTRSRSEVKHLLIDEMQDYTPVQYRVIQRLFPCRKTLLGDGWQSVDPAGSSTAETIAEVFAGSRVMHLLKSYRSTFEITQFAQRIRPNDRLEPIARHGEEPQVMSFTNADDELEGIKRLIADFRLSDQTSLGIVCKTESQAIALHALLADPEIDLLTSRSSSFGGGVVVTSAHMAKGLEFDSVIIPRADSQNYRTEIDRGMLYVAVTRAMHRLVLTHTGSPSKFFDN